MTNISSLTRLSQEIKERAATATSKEIAGMIERWLEEKYNCDCDFDVDPNDLTDDWHYLRTCYSCGKQWYALHCPHEKIQHPCPNCGIIPDREIYCNEG